MFLSTARVDRPYIGQVELLWETWNGNMMVKVKWFYHPEEIETTGGTVDLRVPGGLFQSPHTDENDVVMTISQRVYQGFGLHGNEEENSFFKNVF